MHAPHRQIHLGSESLLDAAHICALFDGPDAAYSVLAPFVREGLAAGDRIVYLTETPDTLPDRLGLGTDAAGAVSSGQLDIRAWSETYLVGGRFVGSHMLAEVRESLRRGSPLGYPATRLIGEMEWAQEGVAGVEELATYESGIDAILGRSPHTVVCAYDVRRHTASRIAEVLAAHRAALVGGRLQRTNGRHTPPSSRDRILSAASRLFADGGVRATGVDTLIASAGVAKATFYRHFPSKDDLIVAWLEDSRTRWFERVRATAEAKAATPHEVIPAFFEALADWLEAGDFKGCPYLNTAIELGDPDHRATPVVRAYLSEIRGYLAEMLSAAGYRDAADLASDLQMLVAGSTSLGVAHRSSSFATSAGDASARLLANAARV
ncbi:MAG: TetR family transcriptional regulator [Chloroflexi bacterium]|nr:MAG: TetR family transcriptional regulator [Chloroflexota bacterium]